MPGTTTARECLTRTLTGSFQVAEEEVESGERTLSDLGLDSLAVVELTDLLAAGLDRMLADDTLNSAMTVDEAVAALEAAQAS